VLLTKEFSRRLQRTTSELNNATDNLRARVEVLEGSLQKIGPGVSAWIQLPSGVELGYTKMNKGWRLCIKQKEQTWEFNEAPRQLRFESVDSIPLLLEQLLTNVEKLLELATSRVSLVHSMSQAICDMEE